MRELCKTSMNSYHRSALFSIRMTNRSTVTHGNFGRTRSRRKLYNIPFFSLFQARAVTDIAADKPEVVPIEDYGWIAGCAPSSPAWKNPIDFTFWPPPPSTAPKASSLTTKSWLGELSDEETIVWEKKTDDRLHWQGRTTGIPLVRDIVRRFEHRRWMTDWAAKGMDGPEKIVPVTEGAGEVQVDGNACFKWLLSSRAPISKSTIYPECWEAKTLPLLKNPRSAKGALSAYSVDVGNSGRAISGVLFHFDSTLPYISRGSNSRVLLHLFEPVLPCSTFPFNTLVFSLLSKTWRERLPYIYVAGPSAKPLLKSTER
ncbi:hypothetical protein ARMSODRAFT_980436 [Armillaria solidipes]|uniref:Uncharacterized protein n=1 Tax=Armillaria solidipes TaxID=1076256 RepID=A0A2H3BDX1_9AGAR|nr:hypothetical protein ARMSODRAFT_980436 [Armillaria solidipes]